MRAIVVDPHAPGCLSLKHVDVPNASPSEVLVRVYAISLNHGEVFEAQSAKPGTRPGWDFAGTVESGASDGNGPKVGTRVVGLLPAGAWAEMVAVTATSLAAIPDEVSFEQAAALPVAGLTAFHTLALGGQLLSRRVLITGATGGVGQYATRLAALGGAEVVAIGRRKEDEHTLKSLGASNFVIGNGADAARSQAPYDLILESLGGSSLTATLESLATGGTAVFVGTTLTSGPVTFEPGKFFAAFGARLYSFMLFRALAAEPAGVGLARLLRLVATSKLQATVAIEEDWTQIGKVAQQIVAGQVRGKAVLHVSA